MLGVVNLDKPVGPTSHDMVGLLRRLTATRRVGHAGTLDPLASGVLPILVGAATRFSQELTGGRKRYDATIRLGWRSATDDGEGPIERGTEPLPDEATVRGALAAFVGTIEQRPPAFSARKQGGMTAHRAARAGEALDLPSRTVTVEGIDIAGIEAAAERVDVRIDLRCGPGTYVRSIARDVGDRLGCGGYLLALRRTEAAGLAIDDAVTPDRLEALARDGRFEEALLPVAQLLPLPRVELDPDAAGRFVHGLAVGVSASGEGAGGERVAVFRGERLLGIGSLREGLLRPEKVLPGEEVA